MAGGGKVQIIGSDRNEGIAEVINGALRVTGLGGGGGGGDVNIAEYGGLAVGPANPIDVQFASDTEFPIVLPNGLLDSFGNLVAGSLNNQVDVQFYRSGALSTLVTVSSASGGSAVAAAGRAVFSATTTADSRVTGTSVETTLYTSGAGLYCLFTAAFTGSGSGTSRQRIGLFDDDDGFFLGYEGGTFGATTRTGGSDSQTAKASFSEDDLTGAAGSLFTRDGTPEAIDLTKANVFKIHFGWLGSAPVRFDVLAPDGHWVTFHIIKRPNLASTPHIENADLPVRCEVNSGNSAAALTIATNCWCAGTTQSLRSITSKLSDNTLAQTVRSVVTGETTAGGGAFVNVKVAPSGALEVNASQSTHDNLNANANVQQADADVGAANPLAIEIFDGISPVGASVKLDGDPVGAGHASLSVGARVQAPTLASLHLTSDLTGLRSDLSGNLLTSGFLRGFGNQDNVCDVWGDGDLASDGEGKFFGIPPMVHVIDPDGGGPGLTTDTWSHLHCNDSGELLVEVRGLAPGTAINQLGKAEDAVHGSGDVGVMSLAVRKDTAVALAGADGDYIPLITDSKGRLWVRNDNFTTRVLSGSTRGRPIQITGTSSGTANTLHTATTTAGELDRVFIDLTNISSSPVVVTVEFGTTGAGNEIDITVPANTTVPAIEGKVIGGAATDTIKAYAATGSVINAIGRVERIPA